MHLGDALGIDVASDIDPSRPLTLGPFEFGVEAAAEAIRILDGQEFTREIAWSERTLTQPFYWQVSHPTEGTAEIFGFQTGETPVLPTAVEVAIVRAVAAAEPKHHELIFAGGIQIVLGSQAASASFQRLLAQVQAPMVGDSLLAGSNAQVLVSSDENLLSPVALKCLGNSFRTSPLKFRYLELYRVLEARFLADVKERLLLSFDAEPGPSLSDAVEALKSEIKQISGLAEAQQPAFEECWQVLHALKNTNRFVAALFRRLEKKGLGKGPRWRTGAELVYQVRCAIVHAGEKDMIFEKFEDGEDAIAVLLPAVERAALLLVGFELS